MTKRIILVAGCVLALGLGVAACGDDDDETTAGGGTATTEQQAGQAAPGGEDVVALAQATPELSTLADAVVAADLVSTLQGEGPFTVFAPTNQAFNALGGTLQTLLKPANKEQLADVLTYHVVPGELQAADLRDGQRLETVQGQTLRVSVDGETVMINDAMVVTADVDASNGVVHVIDAVLTPPQQG